MHNRIRPYAWGSRIAIAELLGEPSPSPHPQAELWIGAHPADSSLLVDDNGERSLAEVIAADPQGMLGTAAGAGSAFFDSASRFRNRVSTMPGMLFSGLHPRRSTVSRTFLRPNCNASLQLHK